MTNKEFEKKLRTDLIFRAFTGPSVDLTSSDNYEYITAKNIETVKLNTVHNLMSKDGTIFSYRICANDRYYKVHEDDFAKAENYFKYVLKKDPKIIKSYRLLADKTHIILNPDDKITLVKKASLHSRDGYDRRQPVYQLERLRGEDLEIFTIGEDTYNRINEKL